MAGTDVSGLNMLSDISKLEAPSFSTIEKKPPVQVLALNWDHQVNLVGKKVPNPMFHCCDICRKPILIYGRMIPCKHVFCFSCAKQDEKTCPRCKDKVKKVEQCELGSIYLCTQDGTRYGSSGCRRTYLSSRDLQAHVKHRHTIKTEEDRSSERKEMSSVEAIRNAVNALSKASLEAAVAAAKAVSSSSSGYHTASSIAASTASKSYSSATSSASVKQVSAYGGSTTGSSSQGVPYGAGGSSSVVATQGVPYPGTPSTGTYTTPSGAPYRPTIPGSSGAMASGQISVLNTRQSNLITVPLHAEGGGGEGSSGGQPYQAPAGGGYPGYATQYAAQYPPPTTVGYTQGSGSNYGQPPPSAYPYPGNYGAAASAGQYPGGAPPPGAVPGAVPGSYPAGGGAPPPGAVPGTYPTGAGAPPPGAVPGSYPSAGPAPASAATSGMPPYQSHFNRPPPTAVRPPPGAGRQVAAVPGAPPGVGGGAPRPGGQQRPPGGYYRR